MNPKHPWQARLGVTLIMLILAFIGMVVTDTQARGGWDYWKWVVPIYAILALWLSWYMKKQMQEPVAYTAYHEILHWGGVVAAAFLVSGYVHFGVMSRYAAGLSDLTILALGIFLAGVYIEKTFIFIGIVLGLLAVFSAFITEYLYALMIPVMLGSALVIGLIVWISHQKFNDKKNTYR